MRFSSPVVAALLLSAVALAQQPAADPLIKSGVTKQIGAHNQSFLAATAVSSMKAWLAAFDTLEALQPKTIVPSHGAVGDASLIEANRAVMLAVQSRARELKAQGRSADETAALVQKEMQANHPGWPRANGLVAAARSAWSEAP